MRYFQVFWGCDPTRQYEYAWLLHLFKDSIVSHHYVHETDFDSSLIRDDCVPVLVESGLLCLQSNPSSQQLELLDQQRVIRLRKLQGNSKLIIIHLSDEEGNDALRWYSYLQPKTIVWRNFYHDFLVKYDLQLTHFPIGPRDPFLDKDLSQLVPSPSSSRTYPWCFMGTLWSSGSRLSAVSHFLRKLPDGFYFGGSHFGHGIPLDQYRLKLMNSKFALAPEGDRHLDTFRLWESLSSGTIPLVVDHNSKASHLLTDSFPVPIFKTWPEAVDFVYPYLTNDIALDQLQSQVFNWWSMRISTLSAQLTS